MSQTKRIGLVLVPVVIGVLGWLWYQNREVAAPVEVAPVGAADVQPEIAAPLEPELPAPVVSQIVEGVEPKPTARPDDLALDAVEGEAAQLLNEVVEAIIPPVDTPVEVEQKPVPVPQVTAVPEVNEPPVEQAAEVSAPATATSTANAAEEAAESRADIEETVAQEEVEQEAIGQMVPPQGVEIIVAETAAPAVVTQQAVPEPVEIADARIPEEPAVADTPSEEAPVDEGPSEERRPVEINPVEINPVETNPVDIPAAPVETAQLVEGAAQPAPEFDLVRVETDGSTVIAGRAQPGAEVSITADGVVIGTAQASSRGEFVAMVDTPQTGLAQELRLQTGAQEDGTQSASQEAVIVIVDTPDGDAQEAAAPVVVISTPATVEVVQPALPAADGQIVLDTISYSAEGEVVLSGRGQPGSAARIYANGAPVTEADIRQDGNWSVVVNTLDVGDYMLRVDEVSDVGEVTSRAESPFRRVEPELAVATLAEVGPLQQIVVQPGNNLWTIARERYGRGPLYTQIFTANADQIRDPDLIYPGQIFSLPGE